MSCGGYMLLTPAEVLGSLVFMILVGFAAGYMWRALIGAAE